MESEDKKGDRWLRLGDLAPHEVIVVRCPCGRSVEYFPGFLQRRHRLPSDFLVYDLQFRLRWGVGAGEIFASRSLLPLDHPAHQSPRRHLIIALHSSPQLPPPF